MFAACNSNSTAMMNEMGESCTVSETIARGGGNTLSSGLKPNFFDSIKGCWGTHPKTGNSILCFTSPDSVFWVDPSVWCNYRIVGDSIIMEIDGMVYFQGEIGIQDDSLFLKDFDQTWMFEKFE